MSFFDDLFERKPGGTVVGNILRDVAGKLTDGALGTGAGKISQSDYDLKNLSDNDYIAKYGRTKTGVIVPGVIPNPNIQTVQQQLQYSGQVASVNAQANVIGALLQKYWWVIALPVVSVIVLLFYKKGKRRY